MTQQTPSIGGCWSYADGTVFSTVCFTGGGGGTFNLEYAAEDAERGLIKGSCNARITLDASETDRIAFTVPFQERACRQEDVVFRVAQREYDCALSGASMACSLTVYADDGSIYAEAEGLEYSR
ncbi:MAG: hypothetical protein AAGI34_07120 [Pseudomonadota bacterium]